MGYVGHALVDWDDTIAENIRYFHQAEEANVYLIARLTGHDPAVVRERGRELDLQTARRVGLGRESLAIAWMECYREFCERADMDRDPDAEAAVGRACQMPYEVHQEILPGAAETLAWLHQQGFEVTIWTAGDREVQARKIRESGLDRLIDRQVIVRDKDQQQLRAALGGREPGLCFVVGNSIHSDIRPALGIGVSAYHVPAETWAYDHGQLDLSDVNYVRIEQIAHLPELLKARFGLADPVRHGSAG